MIIRDCEGACASSRTLEHSTKPGSLRITRLCAQSTISGSWVSSGKSVPLKPKLQGVRPLYLFKHCARPRGKPRKRVACFAAGFFLHSLLECGEVNPAPVRSGRFLSGAFAGKCSHKRLVWIWVVFSEVLNLQGASLDRQPIHLLERSRGVVCGSRYLKHTGEKHSERRRTCSQNKI